MAQIQKTVPAPVFESAVIDSDRTDGYWVETFHFTKNDRVPGVITSGLVSGVVKFLDNPLSNNKAAGGNVADKPAASWTKYQIGKFDSPVAIVAVDVSGNGLTDVLVCHDYGPFMLECNPKGGWITWLENPGRDKLKKDPKDPADNHWKRRDIGRWPAMHRMRAGYFTQSCPAPTRPRHHMPVIDITIHMSYLEIIAASVVYGPHDEALETPFPPQAL